MKRLLGLSIPAVMIMVGFGVPFFIPGALGFICAVILVFFGAFLLWVIEKRTAHKLQENGVLNDILNTQDGE